MSAVTDSSSEKVLRDRPEGDMQVVTSVAVAQVGPEVRIAGDDLKAISVRPDQRIPSLDGLRGVASLMVLCYHFGPHIVRTRSAFSVLHLFPQITWAGVDLFFVLSGFLISGILLNSRQSPRYFTVFYIRRAFRILPLYYFVLVAYIAMLAVLGGRAGGLGRLFENPLSPWAYLFYLQNFAMTTAGTFGPIWLAGTWSLAVEEQFYFTLPVLIRKVTSKVLGWSVVGAFFVAPLLRASIQKFRFVNPMGGHVLLPSCVDSLAVGVLIAMLIRYRLSWIAGRERQIRFATVACLLAWISYQYIPNPQSIRLNFLVPTGNAVIFGGILLAILVSPRAPLPRFLSLRPMREIGNMAYSTYLLHPILLCVVFRLMKGHDPLLKDVTDIPILTVALAATLITSRLSWQFFEKPLIRRGHGYRY